MDFPSLQEPLKTALLATTRTTTHLCAEDLSFHRSLDPNGVAKELDRHNARLLGLAERLLANAAAGADVVRPAPISLRDGDGDSASSSLEGLQWKSVVDVVDSLLERADMSLDEVRGVVRKAGVGQGEQAAVTMATKKGKFPKMANILKPQRQFAVVPKNDDTGPFMPLLTQKPHAKVPLEAILRTETESDGTIRYPHPYKLEIEQYKYPPSMYQSSEPIPYQPFESTTATLVDTLEALEEMIAELQKAKEIAIDLEHHDMRSYFGLVSLMQISTRDRDWIVDTLKPWRRRLQDLNKVFADPKILKVFHGSGSDIIWLQRDFGIYVVGMFDTERAAHALRYPRIGLAYLLEKFVKFQAQKQYQLADWRVRPLPEDLFNYARADTHFLLYIYDCMRNELIKSSNLSDPEGDLIQKVLDGSKGYQLQRYEHYIYDAERGSGAFGWYRQLYKTPALFSKQQFAVFKAVHHWRDAVARREDDSIHFVMNNHTLMSISRDMPDSKEKLASSASLFSGSMKQRAGELVEVIAKAKQEGLHGPEMRDVMTELDKLEDERKEKQWAARHAATIVSQIKQQVAKGPQPTIPPKRLTAPDVGAVKAENSKFWGSTLSSKTQKRPIVSDVRLALPLPELTAEVFSGEVPFTPDTKSGVQTPDAVARPEHAYVPKTERAPLQTDDVFIIKQLGGRGKKRKASEAEVEDEAINNRDFAGNADELPLQTEEEEGAEKARRKAERRAAKKLKKQQKAQEFDTETHANGNGVSANGGQEDEEPFDYANAPSVLHGGHEEGKGKGKRKKRDRGIDPYAKALDAPKGLPRAQRERAGRSKTFKS